LIISGDGNIVDVRWNGPAAKAKIVPGSKILSINGQPYSGEVIRSAIREAKGKSEPIRLIVQLDDFVSTADIDYHDGERYPELERVDGTPAYLDDIIQPLASSQPGQSKTTIGNH
jgi:C-terminal processing protease CtpA/Prc